MRLFLVGLLLGALIAPLSLRAEQNDRVVSRAVSYLSLQSSAALYTPIPKSPPEEAFICGGTFLEPNLVLTAAHCVKGLLAERVRVRSLGGKSSGMVVEKYCEPCDLALLRLQEPIGDRVAVLSSDVAPSDNVQLVGSPDGEPFMPKWGWISKILPHESFNVCPPKPQPEDTSEPPSLVGTKPQQILVLNVVAFFGDSGGGVYGDRGEFIGVLVQGRTAAMECADYLGEMVLWGYAVGPQAIREFLGR